ncbi:type II toxin-antitoxin system Phd/YefM family antitoxin [Microbacterium sp. p3-SID336]|uniref:type II toxin-antitoxin system Phd/YefM family antitoxin n=1 Tax=Microbacterium sp. p3-SID336 TaxID=2916212 RepID=UPI0021A3B655|nr:type II toxin-antitoxin system prevent-host-death family antitoxin [Microbacterium sp. p3-SID336]MCT1477433.1 type II toxin-antitoxin system prevent-host-death family antitoxin [Microbacterium sp. p3-SID336]
MGTVTKTELNQQTAKVLARVTAGEHLTVTDRGRPIAELSPPAETEWTRLIASGRVTLPTRTGALAHAPVPDTVPTAETLNEIRADRL